MLKSVTIVFTYDLLHVHYSMGLDVVHNVDEELLQEDGRKDKLAQLFAPPCELVQSCFHGLDKFYHMCKASDATFDYNCSRLEFKVSVHRTKPNLA